VVTLHDITMIEHLQEQNRKNEKLLHEQKKLASMGEMIGNIAHQWRQPLSVISTNATGLKMQLEFGVEFTNDEIVQYCEDINNQAQYLSKTIDDFRNFIKNDKNKAEFKVSDILNETISLITASISSEHIEIIKDFQCDCMVEGYPNEMIQALMNIINNSKDAIKNNKTSHDPRYIFIETRSFNNQIEIYIKDNGGGIPNDVKDKVFEPYFTTKHQSQGTGIGLYMTRQIIVGHNDGKISAHNIEFEYKNVLHKGAVIVIVLPCVAN
jgi:two-component system, NarL family, sensor histidine kinase EvgS